MSTQCVEYARGVYHPKNKEAAPSLCRLGQAVHVPSNSDANTMLS